VELPHPAALLGHYNYITSPNDETRDKQYDCFDVRPVPFDANTTDLSSVHPACIKPTVDPVPNLLGLSTKHHYYDCISTPPALAEAVKSKSKPVHRVPLEAGIDDAFQRTNWALEGPEVLEALSATGLRSIRYAREIRGLGSIVVNDLDSAAVDAIRRNLAFNGLGDSPGCSPRMIANHNDANAEMLSRCNLKTPNLKKFDVIDLDPYGTASPFVDAAIQGVANGGLILVTCTDKAVLCGTNFEHAQAKYGCANVKAPYYNEYGLRMVLAMLDQRAAVRKRHIKPLLTLSIDFYVRIILTVHDSKAEAKDHGIRKSLVYQCPNCSYFGLQECLSKVAKPNKRNPNNPPVYSYKPPSATVPQHCPECGSACKIGGPIWNAPIHDVDFARACLKDVSARPSDFGTEKRMRGMLSTIASELPSSPLFFTPPQLMHDFTTQTHKRNVYLSYLLNAGYQVSDTHCDPEGIKTDAPLAFVFDMVRHIIRTTTDGNTNTKNATALQLREKKVAAEHEAVLDATHNSRATAPSHLPMHFPNPTANWGPKMRAVGNKRSHTQMNNKDGSVEAQRSRDNQGKRKKVLTGLDLQSKTQ
jgi:tRNA (guanine26-N2/guanine27-N2)-dimethyltransferase